MKLLIYRLFNILYEYQFSIYKPLYYLYKGISDRDRIVLIKNIVRPGMTVIDIGANIGFYTKILSHLVGPWGTVYAFEPDPENFSRLSQNLSQFPNIRLIPKALGSENTTLNLYISSELNVDHQTYDIGENRRQIPVPCTTLDNFLGTKTKLDFLKIDIQGFDYFALLGAVRVLKRSPRCTIMGEYWPYGLKKSGIKPEKYLQLIRSLGFTIRMFGRADPHDKNSYTDFLATRS